MIDAIPCLKILITVYFLTPKSFPILLYELLVPKRHRKIANHFLTGTALCIIVS